MAMRIRSALAVVAFVGLACAPAARADAFSGISVDQLYKKAQEEGEVTFYTSQVGVAEQQVAQAFKKRYPGVNVEVVYAGGGALYEKLVAEAQAGRDQADVHLQSDLVLMDRLREAGLLAQWNPPEAEGYAASDKKDGYWTAVANVVNVVIYNKLRVKAEDAPKSWTALLDPKWKGRIASVHVGGGGLPWSLYYFLRKDVDPNYWAALAANKPAMFDGGGAVVNAVVSGKVDVGLVAGSVSYGAVRDGAPIAEIFPAEGVPGVQYSIAVMKAARHPNAARLFVNWYLSQEGQTQLVKLRGVSSPRTDVGPPANRSSEGSKVVIPMFDEAESLRDAWSKEWFGIFRAGQ